MAGGVGREKALESSMTIHDEDEALLVEWLSVELSSEHLHTHTRCGVEKNESLRISASRRAARIRNAYTACRNSNPYILQAVEIPMYPSLEHVLAR
eukprot:scaffold132156_cov66-Phaeocystis_antarctica.AAC.2